MDYGRIIITHTLKNIIGDIKMSKQYKIVVAIAMLVFICLCVYGLQQYSDRVSSPKGSTIQYVSGSWEYRLDDSGQTYKTTVPTSLSLPVETKNITLTTTLPEFSPGYKDYVLRFTVMMQITNIYIDGELRQTYGKQADPGHYTYENAAHMMMMYLDDDDFGKEIRIEISSKFPTELGIIREVEIGQRRDFIIRDIFGNSYSVAIMLFILVSAVLLLLIYLGFLIQGNNLVVLLYFVVLAIPLSIFYNSDILVMWEFWDYSPAYAYVNDWRFYVADGIIPILGYLVLIRTLKKKLSRPLMTYISCHTGIYILAGILQLFWIVPINYFRPVFMILTAVGYIWAFIKIRKDVKQSVSPYYIYAIFILMVGFILDYLRYLIAFLPFETAITTYISLELPFLFCLGIGIVFYIVLAIIGTIDTISNERSKMKSQIDFVAMGLSHAQEHYEMLLDNIEQTKKIKHDISHHFRTLYQLGIAGEHEELVGYLNELIADDHKNKQAHIYCKHHISNVLIDYYAGVSKDNGIEFTCVANMPQDIQFDKLMVCTVLGNVLQNAFEACQKMVRGNQYIDININYTTSFLTIIVRNSYDGKLKKSKGLLLTNKKNEGHGLGLSSIKQIVEQYNGYVSIEPTETEFCIKLVLCGK